MWCLVLFIVASVLIIQKTFEDIDNVDTCTPNPTPKAKKIDIDEQDSIESYIRARDILNSVDFKRATRFDLYRLIDVLAEVEGSEVAEALKRADINVLRETLIESRDILNSKDLENRSSMSTREFYKGTLTDKQLEEAERKVNKALNPDIDEDDIDNMDIEELEDSINNWTPLAMLSFDDKATRIKKKRELVERLEKEHGFQRGYIPYWDTEEHLYDKYKGDEEKYLDAKIVELQEKNRSHDMYLSEQEKEIFKDDTEGGMW